MQVECSDKLFRESPWHSWSKYHRQAFVCLYYQVQHDQRIQTNASNASFILGNVWWKLSIKKCDLTLIQFLPILQYRSSTSTKSQYTYYHLRLTWADSPRVHPVVYDWVDHRVWHCEPVKAKVNVLYISGSRKVSMVV